MLIGGLCWILSLVNFVGQVIAQSAWWGPPPYSVINDEISELGVTVCGTVTLAGVPGYYCSPLHDVMNVSFSLSGAFILLGVYFTRAAWPRGRAMRYGFALITLGGIGKFVVGLIPVNVDFTLHSLAALGNPAGDVGLVVIGWTFRRKIRWLASTSLILGIAGFLGFVYFVFVYALVGNAQSGLWERVGVYPWGIWCIMMGFYFVLLWRRTSIHPPVQEILTSAEDGGARWLPPPSRPPPCCRNRPWRCRGWSSSSPKFLLQPSSRGSGQGPAVRPLGIELLPHSGHFGVGRSSCGPIITASPPQFSACNRRVFADDQ